MNRSFRTMNLSGIQKIGRAAVPVFALLCVFLVSAFADAGPSAEECVHLARRQSALFDAEAKNDWKAIYAFISPEQRKKIPFRDFVEDPYAKPLGKSVSISGAKSAVEPGPEAEPELNVKYLPAVIGYRFVEFGFSADGNAAKVTSSLRTPMPPIMGQSVHDLDIVDYWRKEGDEWYLDMDKRFVVHASGAVTGAPLTLTARADELALRFLDAARKLPEGSGEREQALDKALWLDTFGITKKTASEKIPAGGLPATHIRHAMAAYPAYRVYFEPMMDMGYWYGVIGDYETSYEGYLTAHVLYQNSEDALMAAVKTAVTLERWPAATEHYIDLLRIVSVSGAPMETTLEPHLRGDCSLCAKVSAKMLRPLASALVQTGKYDLAANIYGNILAVGPGWEGVTERLARGKTVPLKELLAPELSGEAAGLTYSEAGELLKTRGIALYHPDDAPAGIDLKGMVFSVRSVPRLPREDFSNGYSNGFIPSSASIAWGNQTVAFSAPTVGGYAMVSLRNGKVSGQSCRDNKMDSAGNAQLFDALNALKKGTGVLVARAAAAPQQMDDRTVKAFQSIGVNTVALGNHLSSLVVFGVKGARPGSALVFAGDGALRKTFLPSNLKSPKNSKGAALSVSGLRENDTARFRR